MGVEGWIALGVTAVILPVGAWLIREVLSLRATMLVLEEKMSSRDEEFNRHLEAMTTLRESVIRMDKNIACLCQKAGIPESK